MKDYSQVLKRRIRDTVNAYAKEARVRVKEEWSRYNGVDLGKANMRVLAALADTEGEIIQTLVAEGQKAWILEYGRGSLMETNAANNPWLDEYTHDPNFNKWRKTHAFAITGREEGDYYDLDGNPHHSTGSLKGVNLEEWHSTKEYYPISPRHIIQTVLYGDGNNGLLSELREALAERIAETYMDMMTEYDDIKIEVKL